MFSLIRKLVGRPIARRARHLGLGEPHPLRRPSQLHQPLTILFIGQAGARSPFGLRSELQREARERGTGHQFRVEVNQQYRTRWLQLLMVHQADHGGLPADNAKNPPPALGRLSPN